MYSCVAFNTCCFFAGWLLKLLLRKWNDIPGYFYLYLGLFFCLLSSFFSLFSLPFLYGPHKFDLMHVVMSNMYISLGVLISAIYMCIRFKICFSNSRCVNLFGHPYPGLLWKMRATWLAVMTESAKSLMPRYSIFRDSNVTYCWNLVMYWSISCYVSPSHPLPSWKRPPMY